MKNALVLISPSHRILDVPSQEILLLVQKPISSSKVRVHQGVFQIFEFLNLKPNLNPPISSHFMSICNSRIFWDTNYKVKSIVSNFIEIKKIVVYNEDFTFSLILSYVWIFDIPCKNLHP